MIRYSNRKFYILKENNNFIDYKCWKFLHNIPRYLKNIKTCKISFVRHVLYIEYYAKYRYLHLISLNNMILL